MSNPNLDSRYIKPADVDAKIASQATTDAGQYVAKGAIEFNVKDYGAVANSAVDCTAAFQSAINAAIAVNGIVVIPGSATGTSYKITSTLLINPASGSQVSIKLIAGGANATQILWGGSNNSAVFASTGGVVGSVFENVRIKVPNTATGIVAWDFNTSVAGYFNASSWRNCRVDLGTGTNNVGWRMDHVSGSGADVSFITWDNCSVAGGGNTSAVTIAGQRGWIIEGSNALNFVWNNGGAFFLEKGITNVSDSGATSAQGGGSFYFYGLGSGYNANDFEIGNFGTYLISGGRFELGKRFMNVTYGANSPAITVQGAIISDYSPSDGVLFRLQRPATLKLDQCSVDGASSDFTSSMIYVGGPAAGTVIVDGGVFSAADPFWSTYPGDASWTFISRNTSLIDRNSLNKTGIYLSGSAGVLASNIQSGTAYTVAASDFGKRIEFTNSSASTITIPLDSALSAPVGAFFHIDQSGSGQVSVSGASGVTVRAPLGAKIASRYARITLTKRAANDWVISGNATTATVTAPAFQVMSTAVKEQASGTSIVPNLPSGTASGDLLIMAIANATGSTYATPAGWTLVQSTQPYQGGHTMAVYYTAATGSDVMPTVAVANSPATAIVYRVQAANVSSPLGSDIYVRGSGDATSAYFGAVTTTTTNTLLLEFMSTYNTVAPVAPSGPTVGPADSGTGYRMGTAYETIATAGSTGSRTWTSASTTRFFGIIFAVQAAS